MHRMNCSFGIICLVPAPSSTVICHLYLVQENSFTPTRTVFRSILSAQRRFSLLVKMCCKIHSLFTNFPYIQATIYHYIFIYQHFSLDFLKFISDLYRTISVINYSLSLNLCCNVFTFLNLNLCLLSSYVLVISAIIYLFQVSKLFQSQYAVQQVISPSKLINKV